jgi:hypothetical protein
MPRRFAPLFVFLLWPIIAVAGDDPAATARDLAKRLAGVAKITDAQIRPLLAADPAVQIEFFKLLPETKITEPNRQVVCLGVLKSDDNDEVRAAAARALGRSKDMRLAIKPLTDLLAANSPVLRAAGCEGLTGYRLDPTLSAKFAKLLNDDAKQVRVASARAIGKLGDRKQVPLLIAAYKKHKGDVDDDAVFGEALAGLAESEVSLEIAKVAIRARNLATRVCAVNALEANPSMKVIPVIMDNLALELRRTIALDNKQPNWDVVYVTLCRELIRRTGKNYDNDAIGWHQWWEGVRASYKAAAPTFDEEIVQRWMDTYRKMGPTQIRE